MNCHCSDGIGGKRLSPPGLNPPSPVLLKTENRSRRGGRKLHTRNPCGWLSERTTRKVRNRFPQSSYPYYIKNPSRPHIFYAGASEWKSVPCCETTRTGRSDGWRAKARKENDRLRERRKGCIKTSPIGWRAGRHGQKPSPIYIFYNSARLISIALSYIFYTGNYRLRFYTSILFPAGIWRKLRGVSVSGIPGWNASFNPHSILFYFRQHPKSRTLSTPQKRQ